MSLSRYLRSIIDIRKGELAITLLLSAYYYLILVTYYFLKPARDGLFLTKLGKEQLPLVFIITALAAIPVTAIYARAARSLKLTQLINGTTAIIIVNLIILRWLIPIGEAWVFYLFYVWVSLYGILVTAQFWLFANAVYDVSQAKRIFLIFGSAGIIGAFSGGELTNFIVKTLGVATPNLLIFSAVSLVICAVILQFAWKLQSRDNKAHSTKAKAEKEAHYSFWDTIQTIRKTRHLMIIVGIIAMTMMVSTFVDYQFKAISYDAFKGNEAGLTGFLGKFYGRINLISLVIQLLLGYRLLRIFGVGGVILFLPMGILLGSFTVLVWPVLLSAIFLKGADASLEYSVDKIGRELLFLPIPLDLKKRTKVFIDLFVDRWFRGIAGGMLLLCTTVLALSAQSISIVVLVLVAIWIALALVVRREYLAAFRRALEHREIDVKSLEVNIADAATINALLQRLHTGNEKQLLYSLKLLESGRDSRIAEHVIPLLEHDSAEVRAQALMVLQKYVHQVSEDLVRLHLADDDFDVRRETVYFLYLKAGDERVALLKELLSFPDFRVQSSALACLAAYGLIESKELVNSEMIASVLNRTDADASIGRREIARLLSQFDGREHRSVVLKLMQDPQPEVANQAAKTAGMLQDRDFVLQLISMIERRQNRHAAKEALAAFGRNVIGTLRDYLLDQHVSMTIRKQIPSVLSQIQDQESIDVLTACHHHVPPELKFFVVKALSKLRISTELDFSEEAVNNVLIEECKTYYEILQIHNLQVPSSSNARIKLLRRALEERLEMNLERIFRLLGLRYPPKDILSAYLGLKSDRHSLRASAVEFLDNLLPKNLKKYLLPIIDEPSGELTVRKGAHLFDMQLMSWDDAMLYLLNGRDYWLASCALYSLNGNESQPVIKTATAMTAHSDPFVQETASLVATRIHAVNPSTR